jgi:hypothetical protein
MANIDVTFLHPTDMRPMTVTVDDGMLASDLISELLAHEFMPATPGGYNLQLKGGPQLPNDQEIRKAGVINGSTVLVIPATDAGVLP